MRKGIYAICDKKVGYLSPVCEDNDLSARRNFEHAIINSGSIMSTHPSDFDLCRLGYYDTSKGVIEPEWPITVVCSGVEASMIGLKKGD